MKIICIAGSARQIIYRTASDRVAAAAKRHRQIFRRQFEVNSANGAVGRVANGRQFLIGAGQIIMTVFQTHVLTPPEPDHTGPGAIDEALKTYRLGCVA